MIRIGLSVLLLAVVAWTAYAVTHHELAGIAPVLVVLAIIGVKEAHEIVAVIRTGRAK